jgi:NAD(P)-dependent dehydrogenase (short-subunit alcohol dehydrogenase family)
MDVKDKIIVVTGGASGIGRALCRRFKADGAKQVVVSDINAEGAKAVADEIGGLAIPGNVANEQDVINLIETTERDVGPIDLFCSNAGVGAPGGVECPNDDWQRVWDINVMAHVFAARHLAPRMIERGGGYLMNTASAAGLLNQIGSAVYGVTKHAAVGLAEWIAMTHAHEGIKVSVLCPQAVRTPMTAGASESSQSAAVDGMLEPEDVAESVVQALRDETFLILPHPEVKEYMQRKVNDYDRWLKGMNRLQERLS